VERGMPSQPTIGILSHRSPGPRPKADFGAFLIELEKKTNLVMTNLIFFSRLLGGGARPPLTTPVNQPNCSHKLSLCSTVVRNCCKGDDQNQYGKHPILGTRPYTPNPLTDRLEI